MQLKIIASQNIVDLFKLVGVDGHSPVNKDEAVKSLTGFIREKAVILISYSLRKEIEEEISELRKEKPDLILLEVPDFKGEMPVVEDIQKLLKETIGIRLK